MPWPELAAEIWQPERGLYGKGRKVQPGAGGKQGDKQWVFHREPQSKGPIRLIHFPDRAEPDEYDNRYPSSRAIEILK